MLTFSGNLVDLGEVAMRVDARLLSVDNLELELEATKSEETLNSRTKCSFMTTRLDNIESATLIGITQNGMFLRFKNFIKFL